MTTKTASAAQREELRGKSATNGHSNTQRTTRSEATGQHTANQQTNKIKENAIATAQALIKLEALETVNEYNKLKADGTFFDVLSQAFELNGLGALSVIEARIAELEAVEVIDSPLLLSGSDISFREISNETEIGEQN